MENPWESIPLESCESHMSPGSVMQPQAMNAMTREQFADYPASTAMISGVAGGSGLEHLPAGKYEKVYGVDVNRSCLQAAAARFPELAGTLELIRARLPEDIPSFPGPGSSSPTCLWNMWAVSVSGRPSARRSRRLSPAPSS